MAIVEMNKIALIGLEKDKERILENLIKMGVVEIVNVEEPETDEEWTQIVDRDGDEAVLSGIEADIARVASAIKYLQSFDKSKKGLFKAKRSLEYDKYVEVIKNMDAIWDVVNQIAVYDNMLSTLKSEQNRLRNTITSLIPWKSFKTPVEVTATASTIISMGVVPSIVDIDKIIFELYESVPESYIEVINSDKDQIYLLVVYHKSVEESILNELKQVGFSRVLFKDLTGTIEYNITIAETRIKEIEKERKGIEESIAALAHEKENLEVLHDHLGIIRDKKKVLSKLVKTGQTFMMQGWIPAEVCAKVKKTISDNFDCIIELNSPEKDEEYPILLKNHQIIQPFEMITEMYGLPSSKGIDPSLFLAPFYFVFFGMMLSDAGYGIIMSVVTAIILYKYKPQGTAYKLIKLLFLCGISTAVWGALFGGWFGDIVKAVTYGRVTIEPLWFEPLKDPMKLLIWSLAFGVIQVFAGMGLMAYRLVKNGKYIDAVFDVGSWYVLIIGLILLVLGGQAAVAGKYMAVSGTVLLVVTQGRNEKNIFKRIVKGILSLYNVTGYLSDVLSYSRLLALGLATGVIASVINTVGTIGGINVIGIIILIFAFVIGHAFNLVINALGAYVHASRLQYVEFFGKFYEGGGKAFKPFKINTKYTNIKNNEEVI